MSMTPEEKIRIDAIETELLARWPETRIAPSLERIAALTDILGSPQLTYPTIHVGGTNGKTSTTRMIDSMLFEMGLRTGRFTSPHLESYLERISINGQPIAAADLIFSYNDISPYLELMDSKFEHPVSFFDVSVIMPIGLDHTEYLGDTLTKIAHTKSGILKAGGFGVLAQQENEAAIELLRRAAEVGIEVAREGVEYSLTSRAVAVGGQLITINGLNESFEDIFLPLHGKHQAANAATALVAVEAFFGDTALDHDAVRAGFAAVTSPGRCEVVHRDPTILLDAAHNPHGAKALAATISNEFTFDEIIGVVAAFGDKDVRGILLELEPIFNEIIVTTNSSPRSMKLNDLEKLASEIFGKDRVTVIETLALAIDQAIKDAKRPLSEDSVGVLITGSVITVGEARTIINGKYKK